MSRAISLGLGLLFLGCGGSSSQDIVGHWTYSTSGGGMFVEVNWDFFANGVFGKVKSTTVTWDPNRFDDAWVTGMATSGQLGTYTLEGSELTLTFDEDGYVQKTTFEPVEPGLAKIGGGTCLRAETELPPELKLPAAVPNVSLTYSYDDGKVVRPKLYAIPKNVLLSDGSVRIDLSTASYGFEILDLPVSTLKYNTAYALPIGTTAVTYHLGVRESATVAPSAGSINVASASTSTDKKTFYLTGKIAATFPFKKVMIDDNTYPWKTIQVEASFTQLPMCVNLNGVCY